MTDLTDEAVKSLLAHYDLPTDCDCDGDDCVKCSHYPTFQERASKQLKDAAPDLARALLDARAELAAMEALRVEARENAMQALASMGQAQEAYEAQLEAEAELARVKADRDRLAAANAVLEAKVAGLVDTAEFDKADWFWRTMDPDDCGDSPEEAINRAMVGRFCVCEIASSYSGPTRYGFIAPVLDPESDDEEFVHFETQQEAIDAAKARALEAALATQEAGTC